MSGSIRRLIVDTDPGVDDALALLFALAHPNLRVEAITCVAGNVSLDRVLRNALRLVHLADRPDVPVAAGATKPLARPLRDAAYAHGNNGMNGIELPDPPGLAPAATPAADLILDLSRRYPGELTLCAIGPLTNVALALQKDPTLATRLDQILVMGGACFTHGNVTAAAEFNIWCDPEAASLVYQSGARITQVGLDVTNQTRLTRSHATRLAERRGPASAFIQELLAVSLERTRSLGLDGVAMHDPLTLAAAVDPTLLQTRLMRVDIEVESPLTLGMTLADRRPWRALEAEVLPANVHVAHQVDSERAIQLILATLAG